MWKGCEAKSALAPFHRICTPMHTSRNEVSCKITVIPVRPRNLLSGLRIRSREKCWQPAEQNRQLQSKCQGNFLHTRNSGPMLVMRSPFEFHQYICGRVGWLTAGGQE